jgi:hypothetical protein
MRASPGAAVVFVLLATAAAASAQPASMAAPPPSPTPAPAAYYTPPPPAYTPPPDGPRRSWFATIGLGGMGYVGREVTPYDNGDKGGGVLLEAVGGKWISPDVAVGARIEAHTDDAENYTDSSLTAVARFPIAARGRFYLEPGIGLAFHKDEMFGDTYNGFAAEITGGYQLTRRRFACDVRFGGAHYRFDSSFIDHGLLWVGVALGFQ